MFVRSPSEFLAAFAELPKPTTAATARAAFLVAPAAFALADESARDNRYMDLADLPDPQRAMAQHTALAEALRADLPVIVFPGDPGSPDGVFPNNVFATTPGHLIIGRMRHRIRQRESEREDIRGFFRDIVGYDEIDLSRREDCVAELTGALVIDRARGIGYCGLSERCDEAGARAMHEAFGLDLTFAFDLAADEYHTNVLMTVLAGRAVLLAADGFADPAVPRAIASAYEERAVWLELEQKRAFAGNAITLAESRVWMSRRAALSLDDTQRDSLSDWDFAIGSVDLDQIEKAGGSLRCCVAEIF